MMQLSRRTLCFTVTFAATLALVAAGVLAEDTVTPPAVQSSPIALPAAVAEPISATPRTGTWRQDAVQTSTLPAKAPGLWTAGSKGLGDDVWNNVSFNTWQSLLLKTPADIGSPTLRTLLANTLQSVATLPSSESLTAAEVNTLRASALASVVPLEEWKKFIAVLPETERQPALANLMRELYFIEHGGKDCATIDYTGIPLWKLYCSLAQGKNDEAQLQLDVLRESPSNADDKIDPEQADVMAITEALLNGTVPPPATNLSVLTLRMMGISKEASLNFSSAEPLLNRTREFINYENGNVAAAEWLTSHGNISSDALDTAYSTTPFTPEQLKNENAKNKLQGAMLRALLWQQIKNVQTQPDEVRLLNDFIISGGAPALLNNNGELLDNYVTAIPSSTQNAWAAPAFFALAVARGNHEAARAWYAATSTLESIPETAQASAQSLMRMWPLALALQISNVDAVQLPVWVAIIRNLPPQARPPALDILTVLAALGTPVPPETWKALADTPSPTTETPDTHALKQIIAAATANRQGEVIWRSAILVGDDVSNVHAATLATVIQSLSAVGLTTQARSLATEALLHWLYPYHA